MPLILMSIWMAVMPSLGARDLEVHVAQEVFQTLDIGQHGDLAGLCVLNQTHGAARQRAS